MSLNNLRPPKGAKHAKKRIGRGHGSGSGKTAGRGHKGAKSRSGFKRKVGFEGGQMPLYRRLPKRGFTNGPFRIDYAVINVGDLDKQFKDGDVVDAAALREHGVMKIGETPLKVLGSGDLAKKLTVKAAAFSASAVKKIEGAGGKVERIA